MSQNIYFGVGVIFAILLYLICRLQLAAYSMNGLQNIASLQPKLESQRTVPINLNFPSDVSTSCSLSQIEPPVVNVTCYRQNKEYLEQIQVLQQELSDLRVQCSEKLAAKEVKTIQVIDTIAKYRSDRFWVLKTTVYQVLIGTAILVLSSIYSLARIYKRIH